MIRESNDLAENKLLLLYLLYKIDFPLTNSQITQCVMENNWMNYFDLQQYLSELTSTGFLDYLEGKGKHFYCLTEKGNNTLEYFFKRIPASIRDSIDKYAYENRGTLRKETQVVSNYAKLQDNEYTVNCKVIENDIVIIDLTLNVVSSNQAKRICDNWKKKATIIYKDLMEKLIQDDNT